MTTATILQVSDVANELNASDLAVRRLIARKRISASRLPDGYRITPTNLTTYVEQGAQDFRHLPRAIGELLSGDEGRAATAAYGTILNHLGTMERDEKEIRDMIAAREKQRNYNRRFLIDVPVYELRPVIDAESPRFSPTLGVTEPARFANRGDLFLADLLLKIVTETSLRLGPGNVGQSALQRLYESPEVYELTLKTGF